MTDRKQLALSHRTWVEVDLSAIRHNGKIVRECFPQQKILSVLKADAYGHGITGVLPAYETFTDWYAAATVEEAMEIRAGSQKPILLFGPAPREKMLLAAEQNITFTVGSLSYARCLSCALEGTGLKAQCHLAVETGLNREGVRWRDKETAMEQIRGIYACENLIFTGCYTHFSCGEGELPWELAFTRQQFDRYQGALTAIREAGYPVGIRHCCSTGGSLVHPEYRLDMVRLGMMPMGMSYCDESVRQLGLIPALSWYSSISQIEQVQAGDGISYSCTFRAERDMRVGIVTCGYADGYRRVYSNKTSVLVNGKKVRALGRVAMDCMVIDLTDTEASEGDIVTILGTDGNHSVTAWELSQIGESVCGEVTCVISKRVPRIYIQEEKTHV